MKLTTGEQNLLAQRIAKQFDQWITEEMQYQIEDMKDMDELSWEYYYNTEDREVVLRLVQSMISVPVS